MPAINQAGGNTLLVGGSFTPARAATTGSNIALSGLQTIDTIALVAGDRVLVKDQADATTNGLYSASTGTWTRTTDAQGNTQFFSGMEVTVALGPVNGGQTFVCTTADDPVVVGTSLIVFVAQQTIIAEQVEADSTTSVTIDTTIASGGLTSGVITAGLVNNLAYYASAGTTLSALATANNGVLITSALGVPSISGTLPTVVQQNIALSNLSGTVGATQIANSTITYAMVQNVTAARLLGNPTGGAAAPSEISLGAALAFSGSALQTVAFTGDVTTSANSFATTIAANAVTYSKMQTVTAARLLGNPTGGAAVPSEISLGTGLAFASTTLAASLSTANNVLGGDVTLNNTGTYFDGPSMAQGTSGTWLAIGQVTVLGNATDTIRVKLWDGTTVIASAQAELGNGSAWTCVTLAGILASPANNIKLSVRNVNSTTGTKIAANDSALGKDSAVFGVRIA